MYTKIGNPAPYIIYKDENDNVIKAPAKSDGYESYTLYPDDWSVHRAYIDFTGNIYSSHFQEGTTPSYVESDNPLLAALLADHYKCPIKNKNLN